jgi:hypothetical protein
MSVPQGRVAELLDALEMAVGVEWGGQSGSGPNPPSWEDLERHARALGLKTQRVYDGSDSKVIAVYESESIFGVEPVALVLEEPVGPAGVTRVARFAGDWQVGRMLKAAASAELAARSGPWPNAHDADDYAELARAAGLGTRTICDSGTSHAGYYTMIVVYDRENIADQLPVGLIFEDFSGSLRCASLARFDNAH